MSDFNVLYHIESAHRTTSNRLDEANRILNLLHYTFVEAPDYNEIREGILGELKKWKNKEHELKDPARINLTPEDMIDIGKALSPKK